MTIIGKTHFTYLKIRKNKISSRNSFVCLVGWFFFFVCLFVCLFVCFVLFCFVLFCFVCLFVCLFVLFVCLFFVRLVRCETASPPPVPDCQGRDFKQKPGDVKAAQ